MVKIDLNKKVIFAADNTNKRSLGLIKKGVQTQTISIRLNESELDALQELLTTDFLGWSIKVNATNVIKKLLKEAVERNRRNKNKANGSKDKITCM